MGYVSSNFHCFYPMQPLSERQLDIASARKMLGMVGRNYSDDDMEQALDCLYGLVEVGYQFHLEGRL